jgi:hypothetical protein
MAPGKTLTIRFENFFPGKILYEERFNCFYKLQIEQKKLFET